MTSQTVNKCDRISALLRARAPEIARSRIADSDVSGAGLPEVAPLVLVLCWTVRSPEQEAEARRVADNITFEQYRP